MNTVTKRYTKKSKITSKILNLVRMVSNIKPDVKKEVLYFVHVVGGVEVVDHQQLGRDEHDGSRHECGRLKINKI